MTSYSYSVDCGGKEWLLTYHTARDTSRDSSETGSNRIALRLDGWGMGRPRQPSTLLTYDCAISYLLFVDILLLFTLRIVLIAGASDAMGRECGIIIEFWGVCLYHSHTKG